VERIRKRYPPSFKAKVALEAIKEHKTSAELASLYRVHPGQIRNWKAVVLKSLVELFSDRRKGKEQDNEQLIAGFRRGKGGPYVHTLVLSTLRNGPLETGQPLRVSGTPKGCGIPSAECGSD